MLAVSEEKQQGTEQETDLYRVSCGKRFSGWIFFGWANGRF